ncbi:aldo/keto reductase [Paenibacillus solisilvae]|uniref:Aldo/keto reductase n=1 Tax=Paenibacillus solisilvae TaxID=2486751 RepID=A0ABW0VUZ7_9BACL
MKYNTIARTDLVASVICMGTSDLGGSIAVEQSNELMDVYAERGGNFIDSAEVYANWLPIEPSSSERFLGQWIKSRGNRDRLILATKGGHPRLDTPDIRRVTPEDIGIDLEGSLRRLHTDYIDLYYLHRDDPEKSVELIIETLEYYVRKGYIRYYACSNWTIPRIEEANRYARSKGYNGFVAVQNLWNLGEVNPGAIQDPTMVISDHGIVDWHRRTGMTAVPYSSQANGFFSGRHRRAAEQQPSSGIDVSRIYYSDMNFDRLERAERMAREMGVTSTQIALAYLIAHPFPVFPIVGCKKKEHLLDSLLAADVYLDYEAAASLIAEDADSWFATLGGGTNGDA